MFESSVFWTEASSSGLSVWLGLTVNNGFSHKPHGRQGLGVFGAMAPMRAKKKKRIFKKAWTDPTYLTLPLSSLPLIPQLAKRAPWWAWVGQVCPDQGGLMVFFKDEVKVSE